MNINDTIFNALGALGYTGALNDRLLQWLQANGATSGNVMDAWRQMLQTQGATNSNIDAALFELLGALGYTGHINERLRAFFADGGSFGPVLGQIDALIGGDTSPYITGYDSSEVPWPKADGVLPNEPEGAITCMKSNAAGTRVAYGMSVAPWARLLDASGLEIPINTGPAITRRVNDVAFDNVNNRVYFANLDALYTRDSLTGAHIPFTSFTGCEGVEVSPDGVYVALTFGGFESVRLRPLKTAGGSSGVNSPPNSGCWSPAWRGSSVVVPQTASPYCRVWEASPLNFFDGGAISGPTTSCRNVRVNSQGTRGVIFADNFIHLYSITSTIASGWTEAASYPLGWPANAGVAADADFSNDGNSLLFSNGTLFDVTTLPAVQLSGPSPASVGSAAVTFCAISS